MSAAQQPMGRYRDRRSLTLAPLNGGLALRGGSALLIKQFIDTESSNDERNAPEGPQVVPRISGIRAVQTEGCSIRCIVPANWQNSSSGDIPSHERQPRCAKWVNSVSSCRGSSVVVMTHIRQQNGEPLSEAPRLYGGLLL